MTINTKMTVVEEEAFMTHWKAARASWDQWFEDNGDVEFQETTQNARSFDGWQKSTKDSAVQARMDWELVAEDTEDEITHRIIMEMMAEQLLMDICDIAENGDTDKDDPTLHLADGRKKHGKTLKGLDIIECFGFQQFNMQKDAIEYTFYIAYNYVWE
jgi:hypothetical protein